MSPRSHNDDVAFLREYVEAHPTDAGARLRLGQLLIGRGERAAARGMLEPLLDGEAALRAQVTGLLASLDEDEGLTAAAAARWERLLADDIDHVEARARLDRLRAAQVTEAPTDAASVGATLNAPEGVDLLRYRIERELGRGATSTVYLAQDETLGLPLALKILHPHLAGTERSEVCRRFFAEARLVAGLRHPGVVAIYDVDEGARALVMEYLRGGTVRDRLRRGPLPADEARALARTLLAALAYVHDRGVVHGDITPRNVLQRAPGDAVLADFGSAHLTADTPGREDAPAGTPLYLAPEQFRGGAATVATDLFAAGAVLWEAVAGRPMRDHGALVSDKLGPVPLPEGAARALDPDPALCATIEALVRPAPSTRPPSSSAALAMLG